MNLFSQRIRLKLGEGVIFLTGVPLSYNNEFLETIIDHPDSSLICEIISDLFAAVFSHCGLAALYSFGLEAQASNLMRARIQVTFEYLSVCLVDKMVLMVAIALIDAGFRHRNEVQSQGHSKEVNLNKLYQLFETICLYRLLLSDNYPQLQGKIVQSS
ncbi:hypothetical protein FGO68_gene2255 [Halteria grandinella]|uniref:Uncharacterized protein n=1 Tax=Halteria grandinella TaxID=5974 RepID=A0A8J8NQ89_HALGN|nr:hypothetical protein FGO68_gene2255 [Halteria grandinella]